MSTVVTWFCRHVIRLRRKLHFVLTCMSLFLLIIICMYSLDDQAINRKQFVNNRITTSRVCSQLVNFRRDVPIVWVGGVPRSGTTLMRAMLDAHPEIVCGAESRVIPRMLALHQSMERSEQEMAWLTSARVSNETLDRALGAYLLTVVTRHSLADDVTTERPEAAADNRLLCNKDPFTLRSMQRLLRIFPSSLFILLVRDGRAVADSIISGHVTIRGFDVTSHRGALGDWNRVMSTMYSQCMAVGPDRCLPVHYEQLVLKPEEEMKKVLEFVGIRWNDMVLHHETAINKQNGVFLSRKEFSSEQVRRPINNDSLYKWVSNIPQDLRHQVRSVAPMLEMFGYDPEAYPPDYNTMTYKAELLLQQPLASSIVTNDLL